MEIIDILTPDYDQCPKFVGDNTVDFVQVSVSLLPFQLKACNLAEKTFNRGDSFTILSIGYMLPERFAIWSSNDPGGLKFSAPIFQLYGSNGGANLPILPFGNNGQLKLVFSNYEFSVGSYVDSEDCGLINPGGFVLSAYFPVNIDSLQISMVDVPTAMHGKTFYIVPFIKILHNFPLS
ncbi:MAG: hypothetical protein WC888_06130 [Candidatus Izemoplasmatales bacterium]|jgi:hypothetical protein